MEKAIPICAQKKIRLITNMGAANPQAAASIVKDLATNLGIKGLKIATVLGDDILNKIHQFDDILVLETGEKVRNCLKSFRQMLTWALKEFLKR